MLGWGPLPARWPFLASHPQHFPVPRAGLSPPGVPFSRRLPSPPPCSCWEWRLHFSCHLHSQSIRTPQLSRLAELGGRRRRERVLWGLSPPHRSHSAPDCFLLRRAQPGRPGREREPLELLLPPWDARRAREPGLGAGRPCWPSFLLGRPGAAADRAGRRGARGGEWAAGRSPGQLHWLLSAQPGAPPTPARPAG